MSFMTVMCGCQKLWPMGVSENAHAFVDRFFAVLETLPSFVYVVGPMVVPVPLR